MSGGACFGKVGVDIGRAARRTGRFVVGGGRLLFAMMELVGDLLEHDDEKENETKVKGEDEEWGTSN